MKETIDSFEETNKKRKLSRNVSFLRYFPKFVFFFTYQIIEVFFILKTRWIVALRPQMASMEKE